MFLTKKAFYKILAMELCYFVLASGLVIFSFLFVRMGIDASFLFVLGMLCYLLCIVVFFCARYSEGRGNLFLRGKKLIRDELRPAQFIKEYLALATSADLVMNEPHLDILCLVVLAYYLLGEEEKAMAAVEQMIGAAKEKKKAFANLLKVNYLFSFGRPQEAEALFITVKQQKLGIVDTGLADEIQKGDRALARGDYQMAELHYLNRLQSTFPALDNLGKLSAHYDLATVYEKTGEKEKAAFHYQYCADHGGETFMREEAVKKLQRLAR